MNTQIKNLWPACIIFLAISITIEFFVRIFNVPSYLFPAPSIIINEAVHFKNLIISNSFVTGVEAILGFLLGSITGVGIAILFVHSKLLERSIYPYTIALQTVPVIAIAPLLIVWFGGGIITKVLISGLICFFPVTVNTVKGFRSINPEAFDFFYTLNASKKQIFVLLRFPSALPYIFQRYEFLQQHQLLALLWQNLPHPIRVGINDSYCFIQVRNNTDVYWHFRNGCFGWIIFL